MSLQISARTGLILEGIDAAQQPIAEFDVADQLSLGLEAMSPEERKGAFAEWLAFFFRVDG